MLADTWYYNMVCCMVAGALGMILMDNEPNGFRTAAKTAATVNLTVISILEVQVPRRQRIAVRTAQRLLPAGC